MNTDLRGNTMKKFFVVLLTLLVLVSLTSCLTLTFDPQTLQADNYSLKRKLPNLNLKSAPTTQIGATDQVNTSSYTYTIFRRELDKNILDKTTDVKGSIEMVIIFADVDIDVWWGNNKAYLETEVNIYDNNDNLIWTREYSAADTVKADYALVSYSTIESVAYTRLEHQIITEFKNDITNEYDNIVNKLK